VLSSADERSGGTKASSFDKLHQVLAPLSTKVMLLIDFNEVFERERPIILV
jgi:hypothetical protein